MEKIDSRDAWKSVILGDGIQFVVYSSLNWMAKLSAESWALDLLAKPFLLGNMVRTKKFWLTGAELRDMLE